MKKKYLKLLVIMIICFTVISLYPQNIFAENYTKTLKEMATKYSSTAQQYDKNQDGIVNIYDIVITSLQYSTIEISRIKSNYLQIISPEDKSDFEELGFSFLSDNCFVVTEDGVDLFAYVSAAEGMEIEILEGDDSFTVQNDYLYLKKGKAPAIAKARLKNAYAISEEFYIYGTSDRELHDYTYDYLIKLMSEQN